MLIKPFEPWQVPLEKLLPYDDILSNVIEWNYTGSAVILPRGETVPNDLDYIVLVEDMKEMKMKLAAIGYLQGGSEIKLEDNTEMKLAEFVSFKGDLSDPHYVPRTGSYVPNLICTIHMRFYLKFVAATLLAIHMECKTKPERIAIFDSVLYPPSTPLTVTVADSITSTTTYPSLDALDETAIEKCKKYQLIPDIWSKHWTATVKPK